MRSMPENSVDAIVTDPPYELGFMGKRWDNSGIAYSVPMWTLALRVLRPGGHLLAFGGTRTSHRMVCAIEDAGFEIRDSIVWLYGSGFPKSLDVSKAIDKAAGAEREVVGKARLHSNVHSFADKDAYSGTAFVPDITAPATPAAKQWQGWGTALKPAHEPIVVARKPLIGTVAANVLAHGTGALNIDGTRIGTEQRVNEPMGAPEKAYGGYGASASASAVVGRWPANIALDEEAAAMLDEQSGLSASPAHTVRRGGKRQMDGWGFTQQQTVDVPLGYGDTGGASRFFYTAKASKSERNGSTHPTVKPIKLMRWLVRLVTPPGGLVLDPFAGSGTTGRAALAEGFRCVLIERETEYVEHIRNTA